MSGEAYLAPTWMPLGKEETKSVARSPLPASARHRPGKSSRPMGGMFPGQPLSAEAPVVRLIYRSLASACESPMLLNQSWAPTFSSNVIFDTMALAFSRASAQSPIPDISAAPCQLPPTKSQYIDTRNLTRRIDSRRQAIEFRVIPNHPIISRPSPPTRALPRQSRKPSKTRQQDKRHGAQDGDAALLLQDGEALPQPHPPAGPPCAWRGRSPADPGS
jgi:hypothetical protein